MQTYLFGGLSKQLLANLYYNVLFVDLANNGSRVMAKTALKSQSASAVLKNCCKYRLCNSAASKIRRFALWK